MFFLSLTRNQYTRAFVLPTYPEQRDKDDVKQRHLNRDSSLLQECFNTLYVKGIGQLVRKYFFAFFPRVG